MTAQRRVAAFPCREKAKLRRSLGEKGEIRRDFRSGRPLHEPETEVQYVKICNVGGISASADANPGPRKGIALAT
ncbi:hypothetical protein [Roseiarcus sp.]|uniref:hypothetical protein n=1 Tax=Roseiarcus sp. TaxID=1969460 RepID=UPI003F948563